MMAKKESDEDVMGLFVGIDHRVHGGHGGEEKRKKRKLMFLDDLEFSHFNLSPLCSLCSLCPRWLNFLVGWGFVFEEAFLTD